MKKVFKDLFKKHKELKIGLYGPPNGGKTTLANRICMDWLGEEMGIASNIEHETREIQVKEKISVKKDGKELSFSLVDTPGIATKIDYEDFMKKGLSEA
ncbi:50S ribosome-binding GTPase, partial [Candidatus Woesearchaeota archaeon]|nr:50S ribosome-binding GTPase [Candidatus Woesearchaeota archaeon]